MDMIKNRANQKKKWKITIPISLIILSLCLNLAGWFSSSFCNYYVMHIFPVWVETYGRLTGMFSFSVGEIMLYLAVLLIVILILWAVVHLLLHRFLPWWKRRFLKNYSLTILWIFGIVCVIMTLNCFLLYHASPINERYPIGDGSLEKYGVSEVTVLRDYVVEQANLLATSEFFSQQYIMGYYFPFSMEANYNAIMCKINMPVTMCHELSHLKGIIREDEANFIGYLACVDAEDDFFRYSAYLSVISYLDRDFYKAIGQNDEIYESHPAISEQVMADKRFLTKETWDHVEETALIETETVKKVSNTFTETTLVLNGVKDGKISYSRVVDLLLLYYDGVLY